MKYFYLMMVFDKNREMTSMIDIPHCVLMIGQNPVFLLISKDDVFYCI